MTVNDTGSRPGARFSFSPMMRWFLSNSTSVIPGALVLATVNVTGPAGTLVVFSAQPSFTPSLTIVTLTVLPSPGICAELVLGWPHAVRTNAVIRTDVAKPIS